MKRLIGSVAVLLLLCCYLWSCEKDDICADTTATTPNMIIELYDQNNLTALKSVTDFKYFIQGYTDTITVTGVSRIEVPLPADATTVKWGFILSTAITNGVILDTDYIDFNYAHTETYVSRACGFKSTFLLNGQPVLIDAPGETHQWIKGIEVVDPKIITDTDDDLHVKIYF